MSAEHVLLASMIKVNLCANGPSRDQGGPGTEILGWRGLAGGVTRQPPIGDAGLGCDARRLKRGRAVEGLVQIQMCRLYLPETWPYVLFYAGRFADRTGRDNQPV